MNQQIIINDDFHYDNQHKAWAFTAIDSGNRLTFVVLASENITQVTQSLKFDWEEKAEEWLEENELNGETIIFI